MKFKIILMVIGFLILFAGGIYINFLIEDTKQIEYSLSNLPENYDISHCEEMKLCLPKYAQDKLFTNGDN